MRIALLTDIHANLPALTAVLEDIQPRGCERIYHAGDEQILGLFSDTPGELICFGHLHGWRFNRAYAGRHFLNPGSLGTGAQAEASYALIELRDGKFSLEERRVPYERAAFFEQYQRLEIPAREIILKIFFGVDGR